MVLRSTRCIRFTATDCLRSESAWSWTFQVACVTLHDCKVAPLASQTLARAISSLSVRPSSCSTSDLGPLPSDSAEKKSIRSEIMIWNAVFLQHMRPRSSSSFFSSRRFITFFYTRFWSKSPVLKDTFVTGTSTVILQIFCVVLFSVISVVNGVTEIKETPKWENTSSDYVSFTAHHILNETERSAIGRCWNFNTENL